MNTHLPVTEVTPENLDAVGFFCYMSARKSAGYACKHSWIRQRFAEGLRIRMVLFPEGRGFIEYIPGEYAWRAVNAEGYYFIHCLWVIGKSKGMGVSAQLMDLCEQEARDAGADGVAMVSGDWPYLVKNAYLVKRGFTSIDTAPPAFNLMIKKFKEDSPLPTFCGDWDRKAQALGEGLTVLRADQCPYLENAANGFRAVAEEARVPFQDLKLGSAAEVRERSPSPYGIFSLVFNGKLIGDQYTSREKAIEAIRKLDHP